MKKQLGFLDLIWLTNEVDNVPYWVLTSIEVKKVIQRKQLEKVVFQTLERYPVLMSRIVHSDKEYFFEFPDSATGINLQEYIIAEKGSHSDVLNKLALQPYDETRSPMFYVHHVNLKDTTILIVRSSHIFLDGASCFTLLALIIHNLLSETAYYPEFRFELPENYIRQISSNISGIKFPGRFKRYLIGIKEFLYLLIRHPFKPQIFNTHDSELEKSKYRTIIIDEQFSKTVRSIRNNHGVSSNTIINFLILCSYSIVTGNDKFVNVYPKNIRNETGFTLGNLISPNFVSFEYKPKEILLNQLLLFNDVIQAEIEELENVFVMYLGKIYPSKTLKNAKKEGEKSTNGNVHTSNMGKFPPYSIPKEIAKEFEKYPISNLRVNVRPKSKMGAIFNIFMLKNNYSLGFSYTPSLEGTVSKMIEFIQEGIKNLSDKLNSPVGDLFS